MKSRFYVIAEGALYAIISAGAPWMAFLESDKELTTRGLVAVGIASLVAAATSVKAFLSQSMGSNK